MYKWTKDDLKKKIELYEKAMESETDPYKKAQMALELDFDRGILFSEFNDIRLRDDSLKKKLFNFLNIHLVCGRYVDLAEEFYNGMMHDDILLFKAIYSLGKHERKVKKQNRSIHYTNDEVLEIANGFYSEFDKDLYDYFLQSFNQRHTHINFSPVEKKGVYFENGYCFYLHSDQSNYLNLLDATGVEPVYNAIHEYGHAIANSYNPGAIIYDNKTNEVSSFFPEFVAIGRNVTGASELLRASKELELINVLHNFSSNIFYQREILYIWAKHNYKTDFGFYLNCFENGFSYATIKEAFSGDINDDLSYATSAYIAFYFLALYRKDPEKALAKYKHFLSFTDKDEILHEFSGPQVRDEVYGEISHRINNIFEVGKSYGRKR